MKNKALLMVVALLIVLGLYELNKEENEAYYFEKEEVEFMCFYIKKNKHKKLLCIGKGKSRREALRNARANAEKIKKLSASSEDITRIK